MNALARRILFATDFSECSSHAFAHAVAWAAHLKASLDIVHVISLHHGLDLEGAVVQMYLGEQQKIAEDQINSLVDQARAHHLPAVARHIQIGMVPEQHIDELAMNIGAEFLFVGTHGWSGLNRVLLGSTAERVVNTSPCPVITIRTPPPQPDQLESTPGSSPSIRHYRLPAPPSHLLVPIDLSDCSLEALEVALQVAKTFSSTITILHVTEPMGYSLDFTLTHMEKEKLEHEKMRTRVQELTNLIQSQGLTADYQLRSFPTAEAIEKVSRDTQADLLVMGTHGRRGVSRFMMGSVASAVLRHASCPILTVKSPRFRQGHPRRAESGKTPEPTLNS